MKPKILEDYSNVKRESPSWPMGILGRGNRTAIKHRLKVARKAAQDGHKIKNMKDLAKQSKIPSSRIYKWENGDHDPPLGSIIKLARCLGIDAGWLAVGEHTAAPISLDGRLAQAIAATLTLRLQVLKGKKRKRAAGGTSG